MHELLAKFEKRKEDERQDLMETIRLSVIDMAKADGEVHEKKAEEIASLIRPILSEYEGK